MAFAKTEHDIVVRKLITVGDGSCGKTCLLAVFAGRPFPERYVPTVLQTYITTVHIGEQTMLEISLWDSPGQEDYDSLRSISYPDTDVALICFSLVQPDSLVNVVERWNPEVAHFCPRVPIILVGTKKDLRNKPDVVEKRKPVTSYEGRLVAEKIGAFAYLECSALTTEGVHKVFQTAVIAAVKMSAARRRSAYCNLF
ncbi:ras-like GTP-binding protein Rho1 isoform X1 [Ornithodoros turicata]|uniref:ras-like GTP-binding protein Rho1 isoform X1 n=1 Tax=Ornithodoros turicata TaxID=34597 RepID=UPI0031391707